ncbi:MAG: hypothetical protein Q9159_001896 [Coniocarpon cinnabarinum]
MVRKYATTATHELLIRTKKGVTSPSLMSSTVEKGCIEVLSWLGDERLGDKSSNRIEVVKPNATENMVDFQASFATVSLNNQPAGSFHLSLDDKLGAVSAADPTKSSGRIQHDDLSAKQLHEQYLASLRELATTIPAENIYVLQISDGYRPTPPLSDKPDQTGLRPRGQWSMGHRPMPYDGGYLPITEMTRAVMDTGFKGVYSMEVFDGGPKGNGKAKDPRDYTVKAKSNLKRLIQDARQLQL